ncbi:MAG TPA: thioredoxin domain-containing protein [Bryobacteraceae bacterium]|nr:thioredoxin domain-containing protein [Bryobacteraceae bacterium]
MTEPGSPVNIVEGNPASMVRVISYEDLECPDSAAYARMLDQELLPRYGAFVAFERRDFPLPKHAWARQAAIASRYFRTLSAEVGARFARHCYEHQREISSENFNDHVRLYASTHGAEPERAILALQNGPFAAQVDTSYQEGRARGIERTPTLVIHDDIFIETFSFPEVAASLEKALEGPTN